MALTISFFVLGAAVLLSALAVVLLRNVFRAGLSLLLCFFSVAGIYITLGADFLAGVQVLIYVGAIGVLLLLALMLTREAPRGSPEGRLVVAAAVLGGLVLVVLGFAVWRTPWKVVAPALADLPSPQPTTEALARGLFSLEGGFVLPFEIASVLLLAAIIGAIVLVMERK